MMQGLDDPPTSDELVFATSKMKWGKAGRNTGILPELINCGGPELQHSFLLLMREMQTAGPVVKIDALCQKYQIQ